MLLRKAISYKKKYVVVETRSENLHTIIALLY